MDCKIKGNFSAVTLASRRKRKMEMKWTVEQDRVMIEMIEQREAIWNSCSQSYKDRDMKSRNWLEIAEKTKHSVVDAKNRWNIIKTRYNLERNKVLKCKTGPGGSSYQSSFELYTPLQFLSKVPSRPSAGTATNMKFNQSASFTDEPSVPQAKKTKVKEERELRHFTPKIIPALESKCDENEAMGQYVSSKLSKVISPEQRMYAEALLTKVLNKAILNKLHEFSDISDNYPSSAYIPPSYVPATDSCTSIQDSD